MRPGSTEPTLSDVLQGCDVDSGCWWWTGPTTRTGAPMVSSYDRRNVRAVILDLLGQPIPVHGRAAVTTCGYRRCVRPSHIVVVPNVDVPRWWADHWRPPPDSRRLRCRVCGDALYRHPIDSPCNVLPPGSSTLVRRGTLRLP